MDALEILEAARAKIADPNAWGKGMRGICGNRSIETCCASEAIEEVAGSEYDERFIAFRALANAAGLESAINQTIPKWNDDPNRTHAEVLAAYDLAIATLKLD